MKSRELLDRLLAPAAASLACIVVYLAHPLALEAISFESPSQVILTLSGAASLFSSAWLCGRLVGLALERSGPNGRRVPKLLQELVSVALFIAASIATVILVLGQSFSGALASSGLVIAVLGFAIRNVLADVFSGIALGLEAPYRIGDWVEIGNSVKGRVVEIGWRTTRLLTKDSTYTILPNSQIAQQKLTNYSAPQRHYRRQVEILVNHEVPASQAKAILSSAAVQVPLVLRAPAPDARILTHEPKGIRYAVRFWVPNYAEDIDCVDAILQAIDQALRDHDLPPPYDRVRLIRGTVATPAREPDRAECVG